jgi:hypothetical protein
VLEAEVRLVPPPGSVPVLVIGTAGPGGSPDSGPLIQAVERAALSNVAKLLASGRDHRHLFVWLDSTNPACEMPMLLVALPTQLPSLPAGVDTIWTATWARGATNLWRVTPPGPWERLDVPHLPSYVRAPTGDDSALRAENIARDAVGRTLVNLATDVRVNVTGDRYGAVAETLAKGA